MLLAIKLKYGGKTKMNLGEKVKQIKEKLELGKAIKLKAIKKMYDGMMAETPIGLVKSYAKLKKQLDEQIPDMEAYMQNKHNEMKISCTGYDVNFMHAMGADLELMKNVADLPNGLVNAVLEELECAG
jgi:hypothetical protein